MEPSAAGMSVDVETVSRVMEALLARYGRRVIYHDRATGEQIAVDAPIAASPSGFLPILLVAGEAVWREAAGPGFGLDLVRDRQALFGYRLRGIGTDSFTCVTLATMEAIEQVARPEVSVVNGLAGLWSAARERIDPRPQPAPGAAVGAAP
jgi:hypothetical protein